MSTPIFVILMVVLNLCVLVCGYLLGFFYGRQKGKQEVYDKEAKYFLQDFDYQISDDQLENILTADTMDELIELFDHEAFSKQD